MGAARYVDVAAAFRKVRTSHPIPYQVVSRSNSDFVTTGSSFGCALRFCSCVSVALFSCAGFPFYSLCNAMPSTEPSSESSIMSQELCLYTTCVLKLRRSGHDGRIDYWMSSDDDMAMNGPEE